MRAKLSTNNPLWQVFNPDPEKTLPLHGGLPMERACCFHAMVFAFGLLASAPGAMANGSHAPISIAIDSDFQACGCVVSGSGTPSDPYVIGPWAINSVAAGTGVSIDGTSLTKSFTPFNLTIAGNGSSSSTGIVLSYINAPGQSTISASVTGSQTAIQSMGTGILVQNSNSVTLDGGGANPNGAGIVNTGAGTINKNLIGAIDIENSSHITIRGWQFGANGQDNAPDFLAFDPSLEHWGVGAIRIFGGSDNLIDHVAANNCTTVSFSVFSSSYNTISNNTADYPFTSNVQITDGSSFNRVIDNVFGTADFVGILVADPLPGSSTLSEYGATHDNLIRGNVDHSDGGTGTERHSGIEPAFAGGVVILNGTYNNAINNNQLYASGGADLVWAQAVPNSSSPIGIDSFPPVVQCNVTASEGGGGVANQNGNVWSGNTFKTIASCITQQ